ncbi:hypothetical protein DPMN_073677 [Dreissena polymorpha]|uniref:BEN domain-containing protein n=1 Tax=Dreissena polymorpha TaxID=45954 RepID=A0A9D4HBG0_DREPO|nr:hypothetical protein DPMN_073672 [Dreissena polymorpha]KAH3713876.1 hypothetical protein DPMN_073677 [Dreissena polymorpha]
MVSSLVMAIYHQAVQAASVPQPPLASECKNAVASIMRHTMLSKDEVASIMKHTMLSKDEVRLIHQSSNGAGNFAAHMTQRLLPELFTDSNIHQHYNYHGIGRDKKQPLNPRLKSALWTYVICHFLSMADDGNWQQQGIPKINEMLRLRARMPAAMEPSSEALENV